MVPATRRQLYVLELLLAVFVCLLMALSASELVPTTVADLHGDVTHASAPQPTAHHDVPQPDGHGVLHALSLCVAVVVVTTVGAFVRLLPLIGGQPDGRSAPPAGRVRHVRRRPLRFSSPVTAGVLLRV